MSTSRQESTGPDPRADQPLKSVAALVSRALSGRPMVGITAYDHGELTALDWSSPRAKLVEEAPMLCRLSPCRAAARSEHPILVADITLEKHWADYAFEIKPLGVRSVLRAGLARRQGDRCADCLRRTPQRSRTHRPHRRGNGCRTVRRATGGTPDGNRRLTYRP